MTLLSKTVALDSNCRCQQDALSGEESRENAA